MRIYQLKSVAGRGAAFMAAVSMFAGIGSGVLPVLASADALNPLTERTLSLSSSSPGWASTDGSNNGTYAYPNSGTNGGKTGETFSFKVSTDSSASGTNTPLKAFTFQYCTSAAGYCSAPGDNTGNNNTVESDGVTAHTPDRGSDTSSTADLNVVTSSPTELSSATYAALAGRAEDSVAGTHPGLPKADGTEGNFVVLVGGTVSDGWAMTSANKEDGNDVQTGQKNFITLKQTGVGTAVQPTAGTQIEVIFYGTNSNYITNPGSGAFFVKINDYSSTTDTDPLTSTSIVDGGVTVANVMNQSIQITTKVLETMDFSVGTVDPDTLTTAELSTATGGNRNTHGQCDPVLMYTDPDNPANTLSLGNPNAENSLRTDTTYATHSYWRLSSNSSGGATVYYAGNTLANTEGDQIAPIGNTATGPLTGNEQFGLAIDTPDATAPYAVDADSTANAHESGADKAPLTTKNGQLDDSATDGFVKLVTDTGDTNKVHNPQLAPLAPKPNYGNGAGNINTTDPGGTIGSSFAFDPDANTIPRAIASENTQVVNCVTAKMRYIANIAATTPAGIYTTKINYVASPQY